MHPSFEVAHTVPPLSHANVRHWPDESDGLLSDDTNSTLSDASTYSPGSPLPASHSTSHTALFRPTSSQLQKPRQAHSATVVDKGRRKPAPPRLRRLIAAVKDENAHADSTPTLPRERPSVSSQQRHFPVRATHSAFTVTLDHQQDMQQGQRAAKRHPLQSRPSPAQSNRPLKKVVESLDAAHRRRLSPKTSTANLTVPLLRLANHPTTRVTNATRRSPRLQTKRAVNYCE
ncbi:hypothetical protein H4R34_003073 [Dimargaris verticillata]|uniref:Uncharacterized protein n=1 Tax=Dimargaris verticillata TaxID=2761393 RepID=A0A9W8E9D6_9FUNG|nr:hypothetical protein H4R34_003073 [Dimargaris verticillata]